jgi:hypothetical protein
MALFLPLSPRLLARGAALLTWAALSACAAPHADTRVLVKLSRPASEPADVVGRVSRASGVPVRYQAAASPSWHAVWLACADADACQRALQRLRRDPDIAALETAPPALAPPPTPPSSSAL